jgi:hypothetical protein
MKGYSLFEIQNTAGQKLFTKNNVSSQEHVHIGMLTNGIYIVIVKDAFENVLKKEKIVVIH